MKVEEDAVFSSCLETKQREEKKLWQSLPSCKVGDGGEDVVVVIYIFKLIRGRRRFCGTHRYLETERVEKIIWRSLLS